MGRMKSLGYAYAEFLDSERYADAGMDVDSYFEDIIHGEIEIPKWFVEQWIAANPIFASEEYDERDYEVIMTDIAHTMERDGELIVFGDVMFGLPNNGRSRISSFGQGADKASARQALIDRAIEHLHRDERMSAENEYQIRDMDNLKNCRETGWRIYGRKLYYNCNQIGTLVKNSGRYADKHDPINNMYVGNLKLRGTDVSWFEPAQELSRISHQLQPESYSDWAEVAKLTNDTAGIWSAEGVETFGVEFNDWANQEMMTHGKAVSFKEWSEEEGEKHGDMDLTDWAKEEEESHDKRYGAESIGKFEVQMYNHSDSIWETIGTFDNLDDAEDLYFDVITDDKGMNTMRLVEIGVGENGEDNVIGKGFFAETNSWRIQNRDSSGKFSKGFVKEIDISEFMELDPENIPEISDEMQYTSEQTLDFINDMINDSELPTRLIDASFVNTLQNHVSSADVELLQALNDAANMAAFEALMGDSADDQQAAARAVFVTDMLMNYKWGQDYWAAEEL